MNQVRIRPISGDQAIDIGENLRDLFPRNLFPRFKETFTQEYIGGMDFVPQETRTYYVAAQNDRSEALMAVTFNYNGKPEWVALSLARFIPKDANPAPGWRYLEELIRRELHPKGIKVMVARLKSRGGKQAFDDLSDNYPDSVEFSNGSAVVHLQRVCARLTT